MIRPLLLAAALLGSVSFLLAADAPPAAELPPVVQASATDAIKALAGKAAIVEGRITRIGATPSGGITFINFAGGPGGFVAVVFKSDYQAFPDGFDKYKDRTVRITGKVAIYKETTPQIVVKSPEQIQIVEAPPVAAETPKPN